jgi:hypothetical protein
MQYSNLFLFLLGFLGVLLHNLVKINEINKDPSKGTFSFKTYFSLEWASIMISLIVVFVCVIIKHDIKQLESAGKYLGAGFVALGYMAQSVLIAFMGKASKMIDTK